MADSSIPPGSKPKLYRIVEISEEELEGMKLGPNEEEGPNPRGHWDVDSHGRHQHDHGSADHDQDLSSGLHSHNHPV